MAAFKLASIPEQVATHLRGEILGGRWKDVMPGRDRLAGEMGVSPKSVREGLEILKKEGLLVEQGVGRRCGIRLLEESGRTPSLRVRILHYERSDPSCNRYVDSIFEALDHDLKEAGHVGGVARKSLTDLGMNVGRVATFVDQTPADAWIVVAGSREILAWFAEQATPAFALFGAWSSSPLAGGGPDHAPALRVAIRRLAQLGHRRIVSLSKRGHHPHGPTLTEQAVLDEMEAHGIPVGQYNLPEWEDSGEGFHRCLDQLFKFTPPTALFIEEAPYFIAAMQYCARHGIRIPRDLSLICGEFSSDLALCSPVIAHVRWNNQQVIRRVLRWANHVALGKKDYGHTPVKAEFSEGGTIGPAPQ